MNPRLDTVSAANTPRRLTGSHSRPIRERARKLAVLACHGSIR
jgi:hypothetical protein